MKKGNGMLWVFILNLTFSMLELMGGVLTGSTAILSDGVHDLGDAVSVGVAYAFERKSKKAPDERYTYGYARYSAVGGLVTVAVLLLGSLVAVGNAIYRLINPAEIDHGGMIAFAVVGLCVNLFSALLMHRGESLNRRAVRLHVLEDVLGWAVVLVGAVIMKLTGLSVLDPILSIVTSGFVIINAVKLLKDILDVILESAPKGVSVKEIREHLLELDGVADVHHIHLWTLDGEIGCATVHVVFNGSPKQVKAEVKRELREHGIGHCTVELEALGEECCEMSCRAEAPLHSHCHRH